MNDLYERARGIDPKDRALVVIIGLIAFTITLTFMFIGSHLNYVNNKMSEQLVNTGNVNYDERDPATIKELNDLTKYLYRYNTKKETPKIELSNINNIDKTENTPLDISPEDKWKDPDTWGTINYTRAEYGAEAGAAYCFSDNCVYWQINLRSLGIDSNITGTENIFEKSIASIEYSSREESALEVYAIDTTGYSDTSILNNGAQDNSAWTQAAILNASILKSISALSFPKSNNGVLLLTSYDSYIIAEININDESSSPWITKSGGIRDIPLSGCNYRTFAVDYQGNSFNAEGINDLPIAIPVIYNDGWKTKECNGYKSSSFCAIVDSSKSTRVIKDESHVHRGYFEGDTFICEKQVNMSMDIRKDYGTWHVYIPVYCYDTHTGKAFFCAVEENGLQTNSIKIVPSFKSEVL